MTSNKGPNRELACDLRQRYNHDTAVQVAETSMQVAIDFADDAWGVAKEAALKEFSLHLELTPVAEREREAIGTRAGWKRPTPSTSGVPTNVTRRSAPLNGDGLRRRRQRQQQRQQHASDHLRFGRRPSELLAGTRVRPQEASGLRSAAVSALLIAALRSTIAGNACVVASGPGRMLAKMDMRATGHCRMHCARN
jgi:hypothetical protein